MSDELVHKVERSVTIRAPRDVVFRFFTDSARWASWWGAGSTIDARVGGQLLIRFPGGTEVIGEVHELVPPVRIGFTYGYVSGTPVGPGASEVTIRLDRVPDGTRVHLLHAFADADVMQEHVQGWRYQLSLFSNVVADEVHAGATQIVDRWFAMWSNPAAEERAREIADLAAFDIAMRDRFSAVAGIDDVRAHLDAVHRFMPGFQLRRDGEVRQCQGQVLVNWTGVGADGKPRAAGANVFTFNADGKIESVTGFWTT